LKLDT